MAALSDSQRQDLMAELSGLRRFCHSLTGNAADADDLLQATVERILQKGMPADAHTAKWTYRVCKNVWIDELRAREVRQRYPATETEEETALSADTVAESELEVAAVSTAMAALPEEQRLALTLVTIDGKTYAEAAEILDVPVGTIMSRIARARKQLLQLLHPAQPE
ncbi:sigma-70 family RNA polymerase sigma factor [Mangrovimicrobium sediminis]|uniref:Sigma-70 family RNA polymerase sigma factor n=1 Tax=Mangrovimicrobium sediminis TaxID=2562682 RepID=A0A4Z0M8V9_9GAMM|nr:sigma-70 family RNA polymerase sigma factor [Haliea sp. SAOS-164]TGD76152.1 sigma-70 family RNA polymerase sigma factor [Haliea sp. SAOS-164]